MSVSAISARNKILIWTLASGRCQFEGCNKCLYEDLKTKRLYNKAHIAHIIADSPNGVRGHPKKSLELKDDIRNLMLLCLDCHIRIDDLKSGEKEYPTALLLKMKFKHEKRIRSRTAISKTKESNFVLYTSMINGYKPTIDFETLKVDLAPKIYPAEPYPIILSSEEKIFTEKNSEFWNYESSHLSFLFKTKLKDVIGYRDSKHYSIFAIAAQPLLIKLGVLLNDINHSEVYQKHRSTQSWQWANTTTTLNFKLNRTTPSNNKVALKVSLSAPIKNERITSILGKDIDIWEITVDQPNVNLISSPKQVFEFGAITGIVFDEIKNTYPNIDIIHIFPAMPISTSIEFGKRWMSKVHLPMMLYDNVFFNDKKGNMINKFIKAISISNP